MLAYWFLYSFPSVCVFLKVNQFGGNEKHRLMIVFCFIMLLFIGLRHEVGGDWFSYLAIFDAANDFNAYDYIFFLEPGYMLVNLISSKMKLGITGVNIFCGLVVCIGLYKFCVKQETPWLALCIAIPYLVIVVSMGYSRQSVAIGFVLWALSEWKPGHFIKYTFLVFLAILFHKTAIIMLSFSVIIDRKIISFKILFLLPIVLIILYFSVMSFLADKWEFYTNVFHSAGGYIRIFLNLIPALLFFVLKSRFRKSDTYPLLVIFSMISILSVPFVFQLSTIVDRMMLYFMPLQMIVYSTISHSIKQKNEKFLFNFGIVLFYGLLLWVWLNYSNFVSRWVPYDWALNLGR